jgi:hypothetical protein
LRIGIGPFRFNAPAPIMLATLRRDGVCGQTS